MKNEIIFVFAVIIIVVLNFFLLNRFSQENNAFARNYVRATQLVQERIRALLSIHEKNKEKVIVIDGRFYDWSKVFGGSIIIPPCTDILDPTKNCGDFIFSYCLSTNRLTETRCIIRNKEPYTDASWGIKKDIAPFFQKIRITNTESNIKKVTVFIWWYDALGLRKSVITREFKIP